MIINKAFKFRIYPNKEQRQILAKHFGCVRFIFNFFLRLCIDFYATNQDKEKRSLTYYDNAMALVPLKKQEQYQWLNDINSQVLQTALRNLDIAYRNFFNKKAKFPKFKKKHDTQSFTVPQHFSLKGGILNIPKCLGIKIVLHRPIEGIMKSVTISRTSSGKYFASILSEIDMPETDYIGDEIGIDYGIKAFVTTSSAEVIDSPKHLRKSEKKLKRFHRRVSRKQKGSRSRIKAIKRLARQHERVANQRKDFLHKTSKRLVSENQAIHIENLAVSNMVKNHKLAKSISDSGWGTFVIMLKYKGIWHGCRITEIDRWFPSSKRCNICGYINESLTLNDRIWQCPKCITNHDRDLNAALNILTFGRAGIART